MSRGRKVGQVVRQTCTDHCSACGGHFHGLKAFDAHIPVCGHAKFQEATNSKGRQLLQVWTNEGFCELGKDCYEDGTLVRSHHPVTIYQVVPSDAAVAWFEGNRS